MTLDIARLIEMRDAAEAAAMAAENDAFGPERAFSLAMVKAVRHPSKGGGLLERHAMLEKLWRAYESNDGNGLVAALKALRASEASPGVGEA